LIGSGGAGALENLRDLARGTYPPLLADLGLAAALNAQAAKSPLPVTVEADGVGRFGQDAEAAVYFCCLEALQNTAKYGPVRPRPGHRHHRRPPPPLLCASWGPFMRCATSVPEVAGQDGQSRALTRHPPASKPRPEGRASRGGPCDTLSGR
jgi:hypothetical protein